MTITMMITTTIAEPIRDVIGNDDNDDVNDDNNDDHNDGAWVLVSVSHTLAIAIAQKHATMLPGIQLRLSNHHRLNNEYWTMIK